MSELQPQAHVLSGSMDGHGQKVDTLHAALVSREIVFGPLLLHVSLWRHAVRRWDAPQPCLRNRLAALRAEHALSRRELATALHLSLATFQALEAGTYTPTLPLALQISNYFSLAVEDIFSFS